MEFFAVQKLALKKTKNLKLQRFADKTIGNSRDCVAIASAMWDKDTINYTESGYVLFLNVRNKPIGWALVSIGGQCGAHIDKRVIFSHALLCGASNIVLYHNHPSGNPSPSNSDIGLTKIIADAAKQIDINVLDHIIMTDDPKNYYSFADMGTI